MTNKQMEYFDAVCRTGNITAAAEELFVSRSVISRAIQELEDEFSTVLLVRGHDGVTPTFSGEILREFFTQVRGGYAALQNSLQKLSEKSRTEPLRVGITGTCGCRFYPKLFWEFRNHFPGVEIEVSEHSAFDAYELVAAGKIDFFFTPVSQYNRSSLEEDDMESMLARRECYHSQTVFCTATGSKLAGHSSVTYDEISHLNFAALNSRLPVGWPLHVSLSTNQLQLLHMTVADGLLSAILPYDMAKNWDDVVTIPFQPPLEYTVYLLWNRGIPHTDTFKEALDFLMEYDFEECEEE